MRTEFQIASAIKNYVTAHKAVTNSDIELDQIRDEMNTLRLRMAMELDQQGLFRSPYLGYTQFHTFSTKRDMNRKVIYVDVPRIFSSLDNKPCIAYVGGSNLLSAYRIITGNQNAWIDKGPSYLRGYKTVHYTDGRLTFRLDGPETITVGAFFMRPIELAPFGYKWKEDYYPVPGDVADMMIGKIAESYLRQMFRLPLQPNTQSENLPPAR